MAEGTKIEWADHTFNPWIGCTKVSPACDNCYAEDWAKRFKGPAWGKERRRTSAANWKQPLKWNREAAAFRAQHGRAPMVFCASLADVFDNQVPDEWRRDLWELIQATPNLIWLLLTKRPQNIAKMLPQWYFQGQQESCWGPEGWPHVWLGTTVENQAEADRRIPHLLRVPAAKRFLSCEPLLGPVDLRDICTGHHFISALNGSAWHEGPGLNKFERNHTGQIDWVIAGGESGRAARPSHPDWFRALRDQCAAAGVPFLFKQWGEWIEWRHHDDGPYVQTLIEGTEDADAALSDCVNPGFLTPRGDFAWSLDDIPADEARLMDRVGKKAAGRALDGVIHDGRPEA